MQALANDEIPGSELCDGPITRIVFRGNRVTRSRVMLRELALRPGETCSIDRVLDGIQRLTDLGLFRSVRAEFVRIGPSRNPELAAARPAAGFEQDALADSKNASGSSDLLIDDVAFGDSSAFGPDGALDDGLHDALPESGFDSPHEPLDADAFSHVELRYTVREKFYFLGVPRLSRTSDGEVRAGLGLKWDNFLGRLHEVKVTSEWRSEDEGRGRSGFVHGFDYQIPRLYDSAFGLGLRLRAESRQVDLATGGVDFGEGRRDANAIGVTFARWLTGSDGTQGLRVFFGAALEQREYTVESGELGRLTGGINLDWRLGLERRQLHIDRFRRIGHRYGAALRFATSRLGSDFDWTRLDAWAAYYRPIGSNFSNLNARVSIGISDAAPFGEYFYSIGGGEVLRGIAKGAKEGDIRFLLNVEYLNPWSARPTVRSVLFVDAGNVWFRNNIDALDLEWRAGIGVRWKIEALSKTDLRIDVAWDPVEGRPVPYISSSLTF